LNHDKAKQFSGEHAASNSMGSGIFIAGREVNHTSSIKVKNEWSYTFTPPMCLHGVDRENFMFLGALAKLQKATASSYLSVHLSVLTEHLDSHWTD
jgi:hypothetical protein